jgi:hypothetical protein
MSAITRDEWIQALTEAGCYDDEHDESAMTAMEFSAMFAVGRATARDRLERLVTAGKATRTKKWTTDHRGHRVHCIAYRLIAPKKKARRPA